MPKPSEQVQTKALVHIRETFDEYKELSKGYREEFLDIYNEVSSYREEKRADWSVTNKVNKIQTIIEKVVPRFIAKSPKFLLSKRENSFNFEDQDEELIRNSMRAMEDYLFMVFDKYNQEAQVEKCALMMATYGTCLARVDYSYETAMIINKKGGREEQVIAQYPMIKPVSWTNVYVDPRYNSLHEMPAIVEIEEGIRLSELKRKEKSGEYFNISKVKDLVNGINPFNDDEDNDRESLFAQAGVTNENKKPAPDKNSINLKVYYGYFQEDEEGDEKLYKITSVDDKVIIGYQEINSYPFVDFHAFLDPEVFYSKGFAQRLIGLQRDANFKMNSASEMINMGMNHMFFWSPMSTVNPRDLVSRPGGIIAAKDTRMAMEQVQEVPFKEVPSDYFQDKNDKERDFQVLSHTVDVTNQRNAQSLTNTATGARISLFESNAVMDRIRRRFEKSLERLGYKFLETAFENIEDNMIIKKQGDEGFWGINKEAFRDALNRYDIKVEANSSSFDDVEGRREEAIGLFNTALQAVGAGVPIDLQSMFIKVLDTFEIKDPENFMQAGGEMAGPMGAGGQLPAPEPEADTAEEQTQAIVGGQQPF